MWNSRTHLLKSFSDLKHNRFWPLCLGGPPRAGLNSPFPGTPRWPGLASLTFP